MECAADNCLVCDCTFGATECEARYAGHIVVEPCAAFPGPAIADADTGVGREPGNRDQRHRKVIQGVEHCRLFDLVPAGPAWEAEPTGVVWRRADAISLCKPSPNPQIEVFCEAIHPWVQTGGERRR